MATDIIAAAPAGIGSPPNMATGAFVASGNAVSLVCGFNPRLVEIMNETQNVTYRKLQGNSPNACRKSASNGTTIDTTGLVIFPADTGLNEPGSTVLIAGSCFAAGDKVAWVVEG